MPLSPEQFLQERYQIIKLIGQGGFGAVYGAWDTSVNQICAVKENLDTSDEARRQFEREATILAGLRHPHLPLVTNHFSIPGQGQYLVMDFVEGKDLDKMLEQHKVLPERRVLKWIAQVCQALAYLHNQPSPIIHRDIKPANIKIQPDGRMMLVDFGIAKVYHAQQSTTVGAKAVTPGYSPPEQYGHGRTDARSDIYALGATLYALLTGQPPPEAIDRLVHNTPLKPPRQLNSKISPVVEQAIVKALEVESENRFQSIDEFEAALAGRIKHQSSPLQLLGLFVSVTLLVILVGGVGAILTGIVNPTQLEDTMRSLPALIAPATPTPKPVPTTKITLPDGQHSADFALAYNNEGIDYYDVGNYDQAIVNFNQAIKLRPNFTEAYFNRGLALHAKGIHNAALEDYNQALRLKSDYEAVYFSRANLYLHMQENDLAITDYEKFLELSNNPDLRQKVEEQLRKLRAE